MWKRQHSDSNTILRLSNDGMHLEASNIYSIFHNWHHMKTHQTNNSKLSKADKPKTIKMKTF